MKKKVKIKRRKLKILFPFAIEIALLFGAEE